VYINVASECLSQEALLAKEEEELKGLRKLRGTDKVAARKAQAATEGSEDAPVCRWMRPRCTEGSGRRHRRHDSGHGGRRRHSGGGSRGTRRRRGGGRGGGRDGGSGRAREGRLRAVARLASGVDAGRQAPRRRRPRSCVGGAAVGRQTAVCAGTASPSPLRPTGGFQALLRQGDSSSSRRRYPDAEALAAAGEARVGAAGVAARGGHFTFGVPLQEMIWRKWQKSAENPLNQPYARLGGPEGATGIELCTEIGATVTMQNR